MNGDDVFTRIQDFTRVRDHDLLPGGLVAVRKRVVPEHSAGDADTRDFLAVDPNHRAVVHVHPQCQPRRDFVCLHIEHAPQIHRREPVLHREDRPVVAISVANGCPAVFPTVVLIESELAPGGSRRGRLGGAFSESPARLPGSDERNRFTGSSSQSCRTPRTSQVVVERGMNQLHRTARATRRRWPGKTGAVVHSVNALIRRVAQRQHFAVREPVDVRPEHNRRA